MNCKFDILDDKVVVLIVFVDVYYSLSIFVYLISFSSLE